MVIPQFLNFYWITFIEDLQIHQKHHDKESGVLEMVKIKLLEVKLQKFAKSSTWVQKG